jgi:hypothetical protein
MQFGTVISTVSGSMENVAVTGVGVKTVDASQAQDCDSMENVAVTGVGVKTVDASQAQDPVRKDLLTKLVQEGILQPEYEKESDAIVVPDGDIQLEALTKKFGDLHLEYGTSRRHDWLSTMELLSRISRKCILFHHGRSGEARAEKSRSSLSQNLQ